jgi:hypothetical protein
MRSDPEAFGPSLDAVQALQNAISAIGGARWAVGTTYECDGVLIDSWIEETNLPSETLLIVHPQHWNGRRLPKRALLAPAGTGMHAKTLLVRGTDGVAVQIGSGNLTFAGVGGRQRDIVWTHATRSGAGISGLLSRLVKWLTSQIHEMPFRASLRWTTRLKELAGVLPRARPGEPELLDNSDQPLLDQLRARVGQKILSSVTAITPYLAPEPLARFPKARKLAIIVPGAPGQRRFVRAKGLSPWRDRLRYFAHEGTRFTHAKIYIFGYRDSGLLAFGSANCTQAGLMSRVSLNSGNRAEVLIVMPLDHRQLQAIERGLGSLPLQGTLEESPDEPEGAIQMPTLVAWYYAASHTIEVWISGEAPATTATLHEASGKRMGSLSLKKTDGCYRAQVPASWAFAPNEVSRQLCWGSLRGPVCFIEAPEPDDSDLSTLWGGDASFGSSGTPTGGKLSSREGAANTLESPGAVLDEYELRSERVCRHLRHQLFSSLPEGIDRVLRVWSERPSLGLGPLPETLATGMRIFLGHRLIAALRHSHLDPAILRDRIQALRNEVSKLRKSYIPAKLRHHLEKWARVARWPEDRVKERSRR